LDYQDNIIIDILWAYSLLLVVKDIVYKFLLKKQYCEQGSKKDKRSD